MFDGTVRQVQPVVVPGAGVVERDLLGGVVRHENAYRGESRERVRLFVGLEEGPIAGHQVTAQSRLLIDDLLLEVVQLSDHGVRVIEQVRRGR